jgi:hypothetical protein
MRMQAVETLIDEALEACEPYAKLVHRLRALRRGSEQYLELLSDVAVAAEIMSAKAEQVGQTSIRSWTPSRTEIGLELADKSTPEPTSRVPHHVVVGGEE